ncbi:glycosyl hydrolase family 35 [Paenibacillus sp. CAA11]|nr:glycosyl hydrolase family 35 [Paenibacillus sp. CAA11]
MNSYRIEVRNDRKWIRPLQGRMQGISPAGDRISFTNYYMEKNGEPFFGICGEFHYCRYDERFWEDEIVKMKLGGVNIVSSYIFWNVHEELQGSFDWEGRRNLRRFIELCGRHGLYAIIRIGPFNHGEIRNGGLPDWLFGRPFAVRSNDEHYLTNVKRLFEEISAQVQGLLFKQGGPIIGTQIENEHNHSAAMWAMTSGVSNQWLPSGSGGTYHMLRLKELAVQAGIDTPIYTCTAWGGASVPVGEMLPLWGGYSHWPWIYYGHDASDQVQEHPATPEYIFRDKHNNGIPASYNFDPPYPPEDIPYACCEMGGGMTPFYQHRFDFPYASVPAMTGIKVAEGCNFIGYYMYHGGSNPLGKRGEFLNDPATPKISYDFNACLGEFGQVRESYQRTKLQHYFFRTFQNWICKTKTVLPGDTSHMDPKDTDTLRYAVRSYEGSGILFLNNYQDHARTCDLSIPEGITIQTASEKIRIPAEGPLGLGKDRCAMLPYHFDMDGVTLKYATAQLITRIENEGKSYYFFAQPEGMIAEFALDSASLAELHVGEALAEEKDGVIYIRPSVGWERQIELLSAGGKRGYIITLTDKQSLGFWQAEFQDKSRVFMTDANLLISGQEIKLETVGGGEVELRIFPDVNGLGRVKDGELLEKKQEGLFSVYRLGVPYRESHYHIERVGEDKAVFTFERCTFEGMKEVLLQVHYEGDIGYAFIDGELIHDNFSDGKAWVIGLKSYEDKLLEKGMYIYISPLRRGSRIHSDTTMAGWSEQAQEMIAKLADIRIVLVREISIEVM